MSKFVLHSEAYTDLTDIWEYIATDNLAAADRVIEEIYKAIQTLTEFPYQGHSRPDPTARPLRFIRYEIMQLFMHPTRNRFQ